MTTEAHTPERELGRQLHLSGCEASQAHSLEELQEVVSKASSIHALGSRHLFNDIADASGLISLETLRAEESLPEAITVDRQANTVSFGGNVKYGELVLPDGVHDEQRRGDPVGVPHSAAARGRTRSSASPPSSRRCWRRSRCAPTGASSST
jgi:hypothetical protein